MAALDADNYMKFFRLDDDNEECENLVITPGRKNILKTMFDSDYCKSSTTDNERLTFENERCEIIFPEEGVNLLIKFRHELEDLFRDCGEVLGIAAVLWEDISRRLFEWGFAATGKQCSAKWEKLWSEYLIISRDDDEARVTGWKHFADFEYFYKLRSKYIDSQILEDITEYLNSRSHSPVKIVEVMENEEEKAENVANIKEDFSVSSNDPEESRMLMEAINAAEKILEDNLKESEDKLSDEMNENSDSKPVIVYPIENKQLDTSDHRIYAKSKTDNFCWDSDSTQCFLDLRLYVESSRDTKLGVLRKYRTIVSFVSQKMLANGYRVSEVDCKKKWDQLMRYYNAELKSNKRITEENDRRGVTSKYFWQMDNVLKKSKPGETDNDLKNFCWNDNCVRKLIQIRIPMENAFSMFRRYIVLWQYVASQMAKSNFTPTYNECAIKWMELCETYQIYLDAAKRGANEKHLNWKYCDEMNQGFKQNMNSARLESPDNLGSIKIEEKLSTNSLDTCDRSSQVMMESLLPELDSETKAEWTEEATALLMKLKLSREFKFQSESFKEIDLWKEIADDMQTSGHKLSHDSCARHWAELKISHEGENAIGENRMQNLKLVEVPSTVEHFSKKISNKLKNNDKLQCIENSGKFEWTDEVIKYLLAFRFSKEIIGCKKYGLPLAKRMQSVGYSSITATDVTRKWSRLYGTYRKSLFRRRIGETVKWRYFDLVDNYVRGIFASQDQKSVEPIGIQPFIWTQEAVQKLIDIKLSTECRRESFDKKPILTIWKKIANEMTANGFKVTKYDCSIEWNFLEKAYKKTKQELYNGNSVILGNYFIMMEEAFDKFDKINRKRITINAEEPIDFSIKRSKLGDELEDESKGNKKENLEQKSIVDWNKNSQTSNESAIDLSMRSKVHTQINDPMIQDKSVNSTDETDATKIKTKYWDESATRLLIDLKQQHNKKYPDLPRQEINWLNVAGELAKLRYNYSAEECKDYWFLLKNIYEAKLTEIKENGFTKNWHYFYQIDSIYKKMYSDLNDGQLGSIVSYVNKIPGGF